MGPRYKLLDRGKAVEVEFDDPPASLADLPCDELRKLVGYDTLVLVFPDRRVYVKNEEAKRLLDIKGCQQ